MAQEYEDAKRAFFEELGIPEELARDFVNTLATHNAHRLRQWAALRNTKGAMDLFAVALIEAWRAGIEAHQKAQEANDILGEGEIFRWLSEFQPLVQEVHKTNMAGKRALEVLRGGKEGEKRKPHKFPEKLKVDAAVVAIDQLLDQLYEKQKKTPRQRKGWYHGPRLLYYLGYEYFGFPKGNPFPIQRERPSKGDSIPERYRSRLTEARKYLGSDGGKKLLQEQSAKIMEDAERSIPEELLRAPDRKLKQQVEEATIPDSIQAQLKVRRAKPRT